MIGVHFSCMLWDIPGAQNENADGLTRIFHLNYEKLPEKIWYCFKEDSTFFLRRRKMSKMQILEEGNEIVDSRVQDDESEVSFQEKRAISEKCIIKWWSI